VAHLEQNLAAAELILSPADLAELEAGAHGPTGHSLGA